MTTCSENPMPRREVVTCELIGLEAQIWERSTMDGTPVVQINTSGYGGRIRVNLNDAAIWDGDPDHESRPGGSWQEEWSLVHVPEQTADEVLRYFEAPGSSGRWMSQLIQLILSSDSDNAEKLGYVFPEIVRAVGLWRSDVEQLRKLAGRW